MNASKLLLSIGAALATTKVARTVSRLDADDVLGTIGLARRRSTVMQDLAFLGAGAIVGAGVALLLAPNAGTETRAMIGKKIGALGDAATDALREVQKELPNVQITRGMHANGERSHERHEHHS
jgi:hypothetical protein